MIKVQRKLLTREQKEAICKQHKLCRNNGKKCPLLFAYDDDMFCYVTAEKLQQDLEDYWSEEIELADYIPETSVVPIQGKAIEGTIIVNDDMHECRIEKPKEGTFCVSTGIFSEKLTGNEDTTI